MPQYAGYDKEAVKAFVAEAFANALDGGPTHSGIPADLARAAGVTESSVSRWRRGSDTPLPKYWPLIEECLRLAPGSIAKAGGLSKASVERLAIKAEMDRLRLQLEQTVERLEALDRRLGRRG
jgi:transcriptional regulator with XRE-family HTH domain